MAAVTSPAAGRDARRPRAAAHVVELIGPAGVGKTSLARALEALDPRMRGGLCVWGLPRRLLFESGSGLAAPVARAALAGRPLRPAEVAQMARVGALARAVDQAAAVGRGRLVLDEGPVFALAWLEVFFGRNGDPGWAEWRADALRAWAGRLDAVVRLDAADPALAARIRGRAKPHMVKHRSDREIFAFSARFRRALDRVAGELEATGRVALVRLRTDAGAMPETAARLRALLECVHDR